MLMVSGLLLGWLCGVIAPALIEAAGQSNAQYAIDRDVIHAGGGVSQSSAYTNTGSVGQASPVGESANTLYLNDAGFWGNGVNAATQFFTLTVLIAGNGSGSVSGPGIACPGDCTEQYPDGTTMTLTAHPAACARVVRWEDEFGMPLDSDDLTVESDLTVAAVFESCCSAVPALLSPADGATNQALTTQLDWEDAADAVDYTVFFGTTSPPLQVGTTGATAFDPGPLALDTTYYWIIAANNTCGLVKSAEWQFTTSAPPPNRL